MAYTSRHYEVALEGQTKTATPSTTSQTITPDSGKKLTSVTVEAMPSGSAGTPVATKGTVSSNSITVTPSVTNETGYITGETKTGTAVTVSASELVNGNKSLSSSTSAQSNIDVTNYATVSISAIATGAAGTPSVSKSISGNTATITSSVTNTTGYITGGTISGESTTVSASEVTSGTLTLTAGTSASTGNNCTNYANVTVNPTPSQSKTATANGTVTPDSGYYLSSVTVNVPTPTVSLTDFTVEGDWTNKQTKGSTVDITGLVPTGTFTGVIPPTTSSSTISGSVSGYTYSPQTWAASGDTQTCTFSYTYGGVTKTATKDYSWISYLRVGGRIFYINSSTTGATYHFYDSSYNEITDISVSGLANAYYYTKSGTSSADKFYVADSTNGMRKYDGTNYCMWATATEDLSSYSSSIEVLSSASSSVIGKGKTNTAWILANRNNSTYYPAHNSVSGKITCWDFAKTCNDNSVNECTDWFVPNIAEVTQLRNSGIWGSSLAEWVATTKYGSYSRSSLWSSSAYSSANNAWYWGANASSSYDYADRYSRSDQDNDYLVAVVRAF